MTVNGELERVWKETVPTKFEVLFRYLLEGLRKITNHLSQDSRIDAEYK